eukprot:gnl/MRDRNA2_/MRDRNA2_124543_c0_seq1.p1 gnl/MRDRNA2_/MRDRNA2_124543_c0~~gnl/MRDRNA2_/MRDRNA2_124543_c0_seq1.p1  ORF type:complete len:270 (-),score=45.02 gnl/MRDRNA2_/MRDRNA2_124543_c0_seq1:466-1275(-)
MRNTIITILHVIALQAHATKPMADHTMDQLVDKLLDALFNSAHRADLHCAKLVKLGHVGISQQVPPFPSHTSFVPAMRCNGYPQHLTMEGTVGNRMQLAARRSAWSQQRSPFHTKAAKEEEPPPPGTLDVDIGGGFTPITVTFPPKKPTNQILQFQTGLPLGLVMEVDDENQILVVEADESGNGYTNGVRVGDTLRATSCVIPSKKTRALFEIKEGMDNAFARAMDAIRSNTLPFSKPVLTGDLAAGELSRDEADPVPIVTLVVERPEA